ncbi:alanine--tRNA ligase [Brevibacillus migulae]|uniref:hypothetical protein n=1 Tax=Brevibacillus migulae TaxID=1644114 RepID=UPI00143176BE|nr:hypothetical protein [Brevibacillus migulae]
MEGLVRDLFLRMGTERNYEVLPEVSLLRENEDTYYVGSAVMAHMHLFEESNLSRATYITAQRIFSSKRLHDIGKYPLATSFEVMLSIFRFGDEDGRDALQFALDFICEAIHGDPKKMIYLAPYELGLRDDVLSLGIPSQHVISWSQSLETNLGSGRPTGYYVKMFYPYRHGIIPVGSIGFIETDGKLSVDSAFFLERLSFVREKLPSFYQDQYFYPLTKIVNHHEFFGKLTFCEKNLWINHIRSIVALLADGATFTTKGAGHALKKIIRQLAGTILGQKLPEALGQTLVEAAGQCLSSLGYHQPLDAQQLAGSIVLQIESASRQIMREKNAFVKALRKKKDSMTMEELLQWNSERGLQLDWLERFAMQEEVFLSWPKKETNYKFRNVCYSFSETDRIKDPVQFMIDAEDKRMKGALVRHG